MVVRRVDGSAEATKSMQAGLAYLGMYEGPIDRKTIDGDLALGKDAPSNSQKAIEKFIEEYPDLSKKYLGNEDFNPNNAGHVSSIYEAIRVAAMDKMANDYKSGGNNTVIDNIKALSDGEKISALETRMAQGLMNMVTRDTLKIDGMGGKNTTAAATESLDFLKTNASNNLEKNSYISSADRTGSAADLADVSVALNGEQKSILQGILRGLGYENIDVQAERKAGIRSVDIDAIKDVQSKLGIDILSDGLQAKDLITLQFAIFNSKDANFDGKTALDTVRDRLQEARAALQNHTGKSTDPAIVQSVMVAQATMNLFGYNVDVDGDLGPKTKASFDAYDKSGIVTPGAEVVFKVDEDGEFTMDLRRDTQANSNNFTGVEYPFLNRASNTTFGANHDSRYFWGQRRGDNPEGMSGIHQRLRAKVEDILFKELTEHPDAREHPETVVKNKLRQIIDNNYASISQMNHTDRLQDDVNKIANDILHSKNGSSFEKTFNDLKARAADPQLNNTAALNN